MNFKNRILTTAFTVTALFSSCLQDDEIISNEPYHQTIIAEFVEPKEEPRTRTCVDVQNPSTSFIGLLWQASDKLGVFSENGDENAEFINSQKQNAPKTEFEGTLAAEAKYAYFPYDSELNKGRNATSLNGQVLAEQPFNPEDGTLVSDYKYGVRKEGTNTFTFTQLLTMLRITIDATDTEIQGERLNDITITVTDENGNPRNISGDFTFNATNGDVTIGTVARANSNTITMPWTTNPVLASGKTYQGFISLLPDVVKQDDVLKIIITSEGHRITFTLGCLTDLLKRYVYDIPLKIKELLKIYKDSSKVEELIVPTMTAFSFNVSDNEGKLLDNQLDWSSGNSPVFKGVTTYNAIIDNVKKEITLTIPYLYDFKLKPTFSASGIVTVNGQTIESKTEIDFTKPVVFKVTNEDGATKDYTVKVTNTGLPIVVIEHSTYGDYSKKYVGGTNIFGTNIGGTLVNQFVDFYIRGKDTDWQETDKMTVYNADGTFDMSTTNCGVRLRGNTTQRYKKKPFAIKLTKKKKVLGMPEHKRWVLLANCFDHTMIRNAVAFDIAHIIENAWKNKLSDKPGIPWNVHGQNVELVVADQDGNYHHVGNYFLCEQIKIDGGRLDINDPYEDVLEEKGAAQFEDCGYLIEVDNNYDEDWKFKTNPLSIPFMFKDAVNDDILNKVENKVNSIAAKIIDKDASVYSDFDIYKAIDQFIIWELTMNREYLDPRSVYMYMNGNDKLCAGPVWDFDRATFQNVENVKGYGSDQKSIRIKEYNKWMCLTNMSESSDMTCVFYPQLIKEPTFQAALKERWTVLYPYLQSVVNAIEYYREPLRASYESNIKMWPGSREYIKYHKNDMNDWSGDEDIDGWDALIENLKTVYNARLEGMNTLITSGKFTE